MEKEKLRDFYVREYPTDELGPEINPDADFEGLFETLDHYRDVYEYIGVEDSIVRERLFSRLAKVMDCDYGYVYDQWLQGARVRDAQERKHVRSWVIE